MVIDRTPASSASSSAAAGIRSRVSGRRGCGSTTIDIAYAVRLSYFVSLQRTGGEPHEGRGSRKVRLGARGGAGGGAAGAGRGRRTGSRPRGVDHPRRLVRRRREAPRRPADDGRGEEAEGPYARRRLRRRRRSRGG